MHKADTLPSRRYGPGAVDPMSETAFQTPSFCFCQVVTYWPRASAVVPSGVVVRRCHEPTVTPTSPPTNTSALVGSFSSCFSLDCLRVPDVAEDNRADREDQQFAAVLEILEDNRHSSL